MRLSLILTLSLSPFLSLKTNAELPNISGIYPHLAMFNDENECGTGAIVPWADRLWIVTYAPHAPKGSSDKLYEITPDLKQIVRPESINPLSPPCIPPKFVLHGLSSKSKFLAVQQRSNGCYGARRLWYAGSGKGCGVRRHLFPGSCLNDYEKNVNSGTVGEEHFVVGEEHLIDFVHEILTECGWWIRTLIVRIGPAQSSQRALAPPHG